MPAPPLRALISTIQPSSSGVPAKTRWLVQELANPLPPHLALLLTVAGWRPDLDRPAAAPAPAPAMPAAVLWPTPPHRSPLRPRWLLCTRFSCGGLPGCTLVAGCSRAVKPSAPLLLWQMGDGTVKLTAIDGMRSFANPSGRPP
jgi:hypothetical protein